MNGRKLHQISWEDYDIIHVKCFLQWPPSASAFVAFITPDTWKLRPTHEEKGHTSTKGQNWDSPRSMSPGILQAFFPQLAVFHHWLNLRNSKKRGCPGLTCGNSNLLRGTCMVFFFSISPKMILMCCQRQEPPPINYSGQPWMGKDIP